MSDLTIVFLSLSGNTLSFVQRLSLYLAANHEFHVKPLTINDLNTEVFTFAGGFVEILPPYLKWGNGVDLGGGEVFTKSPGA
ncbi:class Ib ribonucleoside-diphosphate reductase assembly flavoprotein NrdI, partial [Streptococcus dysgalactiae]